MTPSETLRVARCAGLRLEIEDDDLVIQSASRPAAELLQLVAAHKAGILALLRCAAGPWTSAEWLTFFQERAAIAEFDGGLSRADAEQVAMAEVVALAQNKGVSGA